MTIPVFFLAAAIATAGPDMAGPAGPASVAAHDDAQRQQAGEGQRTRSGERPHQIGVGGQVMISNSGVGGGMRFFFGERVGVNVSAGWYQNGSRYTSNPRQGSTFAVLPSFLVMLTKPNKMRDVDIRPYIGGGLNYVRYSQPVTTGATGVLQQRSGTGGQVFGGVEMTFREVDMLTISAEGIYYSMPVNYVNSNVVDGFNYVLAFHFYLK